MTVAVLSLLAIIAIIFIIGLLLPSKREFVKHAELKSPPEKIFHVVTAVEDQTSWRNDVQKIKIIGPNTWTEIPKKGISITFRIRQKVENRLFEIEIIEPKSFNGSWIGTFEETTTGTKVVFREVVVIKNPFFRVWSSIFLDLDKVMEVYISNLKTKLGE